MSIQIGGGLGEEYMSAPRMSVEKKKGEPSIFAMILDALGIHRQVAKGPKGEAKKATPDAMTPQAGTRPEQEAPTGVNGTPGPFQGSPTGSNKGDGGAPAFTPMLDGGGVGASMGKPNPSLSIFDDAEDVFNQFTPRASKFGLSLLPRSLR